MIHGFWFVFFLFTALGTWLTPGSLPPSPRWLLRLQELLDKETEYQQELMEVLGMLDVLFASAHPRKEVTLPGDGANGLAKGGIPHRPEIQAS